MFSDPHGCLAERFGQRRPPELAPEALAVADVVEYEEELRPAGERREVPTIKELAKAVGVSRTWLSQVANGGQAMVNLDTLWKVALELQRRGFEVGVNDLFLMESEGGDARG